MNVKKKQYLTLIVILVVIGLVGGFFRYRTNQTLEQVNNNEISKDATEFEGMEIKIPGTEANGYWKLDVAKLVDYKSTGRMSVITGTYILDGLSLYWMTAESGEIVWEERIISFSGEVEFKTNDGKILTADSVIWNPHQQALIAEGNVVLKADSSIIKTKKITASSNLKKAVFSGMTEVLSQR